MSTTPVYALPYPVPGDTVNVPRDIQALATQIEAVLIAGQKLPTATVIASAASSVPAGYLLCDGGSYLRAGLDGVGGAYPTLFAALGGVASPYGLPDGTHFNVPDLRGRVPVGADGAAARMASNDALGNAAGAERHTLLTAEMPFHSHPTFPAGATNFLQMVNGVTAGLGYQAGNSGTLSTNAVTGGTGGDGTHNNMPPYQIINWLIKF